MFDIHIEAHFPVNLVAPLVRMRVAKTVALVQDELHMLAETGEVSEAQRAMVDKVGEGST